MSVVAHDWRNPDILAVFRQRIDAIATIRANPQHLASLKAYYKENIAQFIQDFGVTADPRGIAKGRATLMPMILFPKQVELVNWIIDRWRCSEPGVVVKARDVGASWIAMAVSCSLCLFHQGMFIGVGSAKEDKLDRVGDPDTLFYKARQFLAHLPVEFLGGYESDRHSPFLRIIIPETGSSITGEAGDSIGRGGRKAIFFIDEAAHIERPHLIDAALASTTDCRIDMSSVNGSANSFAIKARSGDIKRFDFGWRDDPRKDDAWYAQKCRELDPVTISQEIDCNFLASAEGILIPTAWIQSAIGAAAKLGIEPTGGKNGALDIADEGKDKNAFATRYGVVLTSVQSWSGKDSDIYGTTIRAFHLCDEREIESVFYDADGMGAGVRGDANVINEQRAAASLSRIRFEPFRGSGEVNDPEGEMVTKRKNKDFFANKKAQSWWALRIRFQNTFRAITEKIAVDRDNIISIDPTIPELTQLVNELSQPTYSINNAGKILVDKAPNSARSPNLADAVMIAFAPAKVSRSWFDATPAESEAMHRVFQNVRRSIR